MRALIALPLAAFAAAACVTINVYFPAAAAEKAADRVIDEVLGKGTGTPAASPAPPPVSLHFSLDGALLALLDVVVPVAHAQLGVDVGGVVPGVKAEVGINLDLSSQETGQLQAAMKARNADLQPLYGSGAVGFASDGNIAVRDMNLVSLAQRTSVKKLVADENADRAALYREIARANGHPEWEGQIRDTFAKRWAAKAQAGWYVQSGGGWTQK